MKKQTILLIDDEPAICWGLKKVAEAEGMSVEIAHAAEPAIAMAASKPIDLIVIDVRLPGMSGLEAIEHLRQHTGDVPIIVITAYGDLQTAVEAVRQGATEYLIKPFDKQAFGAAIQRALMAPLASPVSPKRENEDPRLIGQSRAMRTLFNEIALAAASSTHVLLEGESGTGKELVARAIHQFSRFSDRKLVTVHVAALNPNLIESELFGHFKGAFTGADSNRKGWLREADGTNLFLDEVAEIPLPIQSKMLRALELGEVVPVGSNEIEKSQFRIIAASHRNLLELTHQGKFRTDLFYRIAGFHIKIPPLRERAEDIPLLSHSFLDRWNLANQAHCQFSSSALEELQKRRWPGNIRELRFVVERAAILARGHLIDVTHLQPESVQGTSKSTANLAEETQSVASTLSHQTLSNQIKAWTEQQLNDEQNHGRIHEQLMALVEPPLFRATLEFTEGHISHAARFLGIHRTTLKKRLDEHHA